MPDGRLEVAPESDDFQAHTKELRAETSRDVH